MIHTNSESDITATLSLPSSPSSTKRPVYYVQSPSHDGDKSSTNHHTPSYTSPTDSPSHPSTYARHSLASSASRVSGPYSRPTKPIRSTSTSQTQYFQVIDDDDDQSRGADFRKCQVVIGLVGCGVVFCLFCLLIWCASRPFKPQISIKSLSVHSLYYGQGSDFTGVPTKMLTVNCTMRMSVYNPATFFGIYINSAPVNLMYSELVVANGQLRDHYQPRKSHWIVAVNLRGTKVPLYGAGASLANTGDNGVPLHLVFVVRSQGNVVGKLVKSKHKWRFACSLIVDSRRNEPVMFKPDSCRRD